LEDFLFLQKFWRKTIGVFQELVREPKVFRNVAVVFEGNRLSLAGRFSNSPFSMASLILCSTIFSYPGRIPAIGSPKQRRCPPERIG